MKKTLKGRPSQIEKKAFAVSAENMDRVLKLIPDDESFVRWIDLKNKCTGTKADPKMKMSLETLSSGLKELVNRHIIEKLPFLIAEDIVVGYRRIAKIDKEIVNYRIKLNQEEADKIIRRYLDLRIAKKWIADLKDLNDDEVQQELDRRRKAEYGDNVVPPWSAERVKVEEVEPNATPEIVSFEEFTKHTSNDLKNKKVK